MVKFAKYIVLALLSVFFCKSVSTGIGKCPKFAYMNNFNLTRVSRAQHPEISRWYEIERSFHLMQFVSSCMSVDLTENTRGQLEVDVKTKSRWSGSLTVSEGVASPTRRDPSRFMYKLVTKLPRVVGRYLPGAGLYQVISTDYANYALLWSCTNYGLVHADFIWIWGRRRQIDANLRVGIYRMLKDLSLDSERLILPQSCSEI